MKRSIQFLCAIALLLGAVFPSHGNEGGHGPVSVWIDRANAGQLHAESYWHTLLHCRSGWFGGESEVDDPAFFLSIAGKTNPAAELEATLSAFFQPVLPGQEDLHSRCRFPAGFAWLSRRLKMPEDRLSSPVCQRYRDWFARVHGGSVTLVFPYYYTEAPASMFGHTLLRINHVQRDIWEYDLNFGPAEVKRLMQHLWELKHTWFDYYFFRENCSYHLLSLMEAARPGLTFRERYLLWTLPTDTVRDVVSQAGLVTRRSYRPSRWSQFHQQSAALSDMERQLFLSIIRSRQLTFTKKWAALSLESRSRILDLLVAYYSLQPTDTACRVREAALLKRAELQAILPAVEFPPVSTPPETGHGPTMVSVSSGEDSSGLMFRGVSLRLSLHGLLDRESGFIPNNRVEMSHARFRQYANQDLRLHELMLVNFI